MDIKGHIDNHIKTHSEKSHKSADKQTFKKQTSSYADIKKQPHTHINTHRGAA